VGEADLEEAHAAVRQVIAVAARAAGRERAAAARARAERRGRRRMRNAAARAAGCLAVHLLNRHTALSTAASLDPMSRNCLHSSHAGPLACNDMYSNVGLHVGHAWQIHALHGAL
jgi:hypothetical protein